jgi:hypothetical protein
VSGTWPPPDPVTDHTSADFEETLLEAPFTETPTERVSPGRIRLRARSRWIVHLGLLISGAAALGTLDLLHIRIAIHADVGLVFIGLVAVHLAQRRNRLTQMAAQLLGLRPRIERELRVLASDAVLLVLAVNVLVSGVVDWGRGTPVGLPFPRPIGRWHLDSSLILVVYLVVHIVRRRKRLRRSAIR